MKMKRLFIISLLLTLGFAVNATDTMTGQKVQNDTIPVDSTEYELVVFDPDFETWYLMQPSFDHSLEYFRSRNILYVSEWNRRHMSPAIYGSGYASHIDYNPDIDYGLEFERKLYYYFRYFEEKNHVNLLR